jgi:two-component system sensor histidine kinase DesK
VADTRLRVPGEASETPNHKGEGQSFISPYLLWLLWVIWLAFLIPPLGGLFEAPPPMPRLLAIVAGAILFVGIYLWATWRNAQDLTASRSLAPFYQPAEAAERLKISQWLPIALLTVLSVALALLGNGPDWSSMFIFTTAYTAGRLPTARAVPAVLALALLVVATGALTSVSGFDIARAAVIELIVGAAVIIMIRSVRTGQELRAARDEIARLAVMTERLRIARDLHDLLGHNLSLIALKSELAGRLIGIAPERAAVEIADVEQVARTTLQEVREAVASYRRPALSGELSGAQELLAAAGITYRFEGDEGVTSALPTAIEAVFSWAVREGVTNVIRHSRAHECTIRISRDSQTASVEIINDAGDAQAPGSPGHDLAAADAIGIAPGAGNGLRGLAERVDALGGRFAAGPHSGGGFRLAVDVPLAQRATGADKAIATTVVEAEVVRQVAPVTKAGEGKIGEQA